MGVDDWHFCKRESSVIEWLPWSSGEEPRGEKGGAWFKIDGVGDVIRGIGWRTIGLMET